MGEFEAEALFATQFTMSPSDPVELARGGGSRYPGVKLSASVAVPPQDVVVVLPPGRGLEFKPEGDDTYTLTVQDAKGSLRHSPGVLSPDQQKLTFIQVDLALPKPTPPELKSTSSAWVAVDAPPSAILGKTSLVFTIGHLTSPSSTINVVDSPPPRFTVSPGSPVTLKRDTTAYPGVGLAYEAGDIAPQDVSVVIPPEGGLEPDREGHLRYMLTVLDSKKKSTDYPGDLQPDKKTLIFHGVDLALSETSLTSNAWVAVHARPDAPPGETRLVFTIGSQVSDSGTVTVVDKTDE